MEQTPMKRLSGEIVYRKDESESRARIGFKPFGSDDTEYYNLWRRNYQTKEPTPADSQCVKGATGTLVLRFKRGGSKVKGDPSQGFHPDEWVVFALDPLDGKGVEGPPVERIPETQTGLPDRDRLILAQNAYRHAAVIEASMIVSMGHKDWLESGGVNRVERTAQDVYRGIKALAKSDGGFKDEYDPFEEV